MRRAIASLTQLAHSQQVGRARTKGACKFSHRTIIEFATHASASIDKQARQQDSKQHVSLQVLASTSVAAKPSWLTAPRRAQRERLRLLQAQQRARGGVSLAHNPRRSNARRVSPTIQTQVRAVRRHWIRGTHSLVLSTGEKFDAPAQDHLAATQRRATAAAATIYSPTTTTTTAVPELNK